MSEPLCQLCREDGEKVEAFGFCLDCCDYLCEDCYKSHCKPRPMRNHSLLDKEQMLKDKDNLPTKDSIVDICQNHSENIKYFCPDHDSVGCSVCVTIEHKTCEDIVHIPKASDGIADSEEYQILEQEIGETATRFENIIPAALKNAAKSDTSNKKVSEEISLFMDDVIATIRKLEDAVRHVANTCHDEDVQRMNTVISKSKEVCEKLKNIKTSMHNLSRLKQHNKLFIAIKSNKKELRQMQEDLTEWETSNNVRISRFDANSDLRKFIDGVDRLGEILHNIVGPDDSVESSSTEITEQTDTEDMSKPKITARFRRDIYIKYQSEKDVCCRTLAIASFDEDKLVLVCDGGKTVDPTDSSQQVNSSSITLIDTKRNRCVSEIIVPGRCLGIVKVDKSHVALGVQGRGNYLLKVTSTLTMIRRLGSIEGGLTSSFDKTIYVCVGSTCINKIGMTGKESAFNLACPVQRERQQVFACGLYKNDTQLSVYSIVAHSKLREGYNALYGSPKPKYLGHGIFGEWIKDKIELPKLPELITMSADGKLLFVVAGDVIYVVLTGTTDAVVLLDEEEELSCVSAITFCSKSRQLMIGMKECNYIKVYQVSGTW